MSESVQKPRIRFKGFSDAWEQRKLGDIGSVSMCRRIFKEQTSESGEIPFYKIGTFGGEADAFISRELFDEYKDKYPYPKKGDILISASGSIGRTIEFTGKNEYFQDSNIVWLNHDEHLDNSFLKCFYSVVKWAGIEGSTIKRLYNDNILNTVITLPSIAEQKKIATYFESLDNLITLHQRKYDKLVAVKKALLEKMFPADGETVPKIRFKGFSDAWEQRKLGEVSESYSGGTPSVGIKEYYGGQIPFIRSAEINSETTELFLTEEGLKNSSARLVAVGDILYALYGATSGEVGRARLKGAINQAILAIKPNKDYDSEYLAQWLRKSKHRIIETYLQGGQGNLSGAIVKELSADFPSLKEQKTIGDFFRQLDNLITLHQRQLEKLKNIKSALLEKMFV